MPVDSQLLLARLEIQDWRSVDRVDLKFTRDEQPRMRSVFLGRNGAGKTSILRAMAISMVPQNDAAALIADLAGKKRRVNRKGNIAKESIIKATFTDPNKPHVAYSVRTTIVEAADGTEEIQRQTEPARFPWDRLMVAGYGVGRGVRGSAELSSHTSRAALLSLFKEDAPLFDAEGVLKSVALSGVKKKFPSLDYFKTVIRKLFVLPPAASIDVDGLGVRVHGPWGSQPFHALGDGYRSTAGWLLDFLGRAYAQGVRDEPAGIVIVDEIDEHLHPSWARDILDILSKTFPKVQFIVTTHSPVTLINTRPDELILVHLHNTSTDVRQDLPDTSAQSIDRLLRGQWFGLTRVMDPKTEDLLNAYQQALKTDNTQGELDKARNELLLHAPSLCPSPLEEVAVRAVERVRARPGHGEVVGEEDAVAELQRLLKGGV